MNQIIKTGFYFIFLVLSCSAQTPKSAFTSFVTAVQKGDVIKIAELDYGIANRIKGMFKSDRDNFIKKFAEGFSCPATTANIESYRGYPAFGVKSCDYSTKVFFPSDAKVVVTDVIEKEEYGEKKVFLQVSVTYPEGKEPYYVSNVEVVWNEPQIYTGGLNIPKIKPIPMFTPGFFEYTHPFRNSPVYFARYSTYDLNLTMGIVKKASLVVEMVYDKKTKKWFVSNIRPEISKCEIQAVQADEQKPWR